MQAACNNCRYGSHHACWGIDLCGCRKEAECETGAANAHAIESRLWPLEGDPLTHNCGCEACTRWRDQQQ